MLLYLSINPETGADTERFKHVIGLAMSQWLFLYHPYSKVKVSSSLDGFKVDYGSQGVRNGTCTILAKAVE